MVRKLGTMWARAAIRNCTKYNSEDSQMDINKKANVKVGHLFESFENTTVIVQPNLIRESPTPSKLIKCIFIKHLSTFLPFYGGRIVKRTVNATSSLRCTGPAVFQNTSYEWSHKRYTGNTQHLQDIN